MAFAGMQDFSNNSINNNNNNNENKGFFKNAMGSMGGLFSSIKGKLNFKGSNNNNADYKGELNPLSMDNSYIQGVIPVKSLADSAQRLNDLYYKYHSMMSSSDDKQLLDIIQYLNNYK